MTGVEAVLVDDVADVGIAVRAHGLLQAFNASGVLGAGDVHVARRLGALGSEADEAVLLGAALAVRAIRLAHVYTDVATIGATATSDMETPVDLQALPWPAVDEWHERLAASRIVAVGEDGPVDRPLRLLGTRLYLDRYWREECRIAADLLARAAAPSDGVVAEELAAGLTRLFSRESDDLQRRASAVAVERRLAVVAGGPGTGKTTTVARILALIDEQAVAVGKPPPRVALAAPTGKAAARLEEAVHAEAATLNTGEETRARLLDLRASTLHRLLGWRPDNRSRFRHHRGNRLPHDVVVVDETSMVSLSLMAKVVEAVRSDARLVLVGDPDQLASVEAGAVLGDIVGPAASAADGSGGSPISDSIVVLRHVHRFGGRIASLATAIQRGDADAALAVLRDGGDDVRWIETDADVSPSSALMQPVRERVVESARDVVLAARSGDGRSALDALRAMRVLCAHRRGQYGVATWTAHIETWLAASIDGYATGGAWYVGRPLLVTENDYSLRLYNGDTGVIVDVGDNRLLAAFDRQRDVIHVSPTRLAAVETVHAMTVHKSQGSQFGTVAVILPEPSSRLLTRELLYTAVTRAQTRLIVVGSEASIATAITRPITRATGLRERLWGDQSPSVRSSS